MIRILLILLAFLVGSPAHAAVELAFYSHELTSEGTDIDFPHAFITVKGTRDAGGKPIDANYGFTATKISVAILAGAVKGAILSADPAYVAKSRHHLALRLTDAQFASVQTAYARWKSVRGKSYDLETRNCVHFVDALAKAAGLSVPNDVSLMKRPSAYLDALAARNAGRR